jgi:nucleotide-binding universal stress UspA family protein
MKILFCTDGSEISLLAIEKALNFIRKDFEIDVACVMELGLLNTFITYPHETEESLPEHKNEAEKALDSAEQLIVSKNFKVADKILLAGYTSDEIIGLIYKNDYSAVILGSHGKKGFRKWLGSVSSQIAHKSPIPVLIVKPLPKTDTFKEHKEILIAVDGSKNSYNAVKKSHNIIDFEQSSVEIVSVKSGPEDFPAEIRKDKEWLEKCLEKQDSIMNGILDNTAKILEELGIKDINKLLLEGYPAEEILKHMEKNPKDLVIMGSHGREGLSSIILGSVSKIVLENTMSPILIIHNKPV